MHRAQILKGVPNSVLAMLNFTGAPEGTQRLTSAICPAHPATPQRVSLRVPPNPKQTQTFPATRWWLYRLLRQFAHDTCMRACAGNDRWVQEMTDDKFGWDQSCRPSVHLGQVHLSILVHLSIFGFGDLSMQLQRFSRTCAWTCSVSWSCSLEWFLGLICLFGARV